MAKRPAQSARENQKDAGGPHKGKEKEERNSKNEIKLKVRLHPD
jgi:hypothetical protein